MLSFVKGRLNAQLAYFSLASRPFYISPQRRPRSQIIVSLTSFPDRINYVHLVVKSLFYQTLRPKEVVLVLATEQFPNQRLPSKLQNWAKRGLTIKWTSKDIRSYKKLLPIYDQYKHHPILTVDDDFIYDPNLIETLYTASTRHPKSIVGGVGWELSTTTQGLSKYNTWKRATPSTPSKKVFLTGNGGILYPPGVLEERTLCRTSDALKVCPTADDIWFWANSFSHGAQRFCLNQLLACPYPRKTSWPELQTLNRELGANDLQLAAAIDYFGIASDIFRR